MKPQKEKTPFEAAIDFTSTIVESVVSWSNDPIGIKERHEIEMNEEMDAVLSEYYDIKNSGGSRILVAKQQLSHADQAEIDYRLDLIRNKYNASMFVRLFR